MKKIVFITLYICFILFAIPVEAHAIVGTVIGAAVGGILGAVGVTSFTIAGSTIIGGAVVGGVLGTVSSLTNVDPPGTESWTYKGETPIVTVTKGAPIAKSYGLCRVAGNIVRQNDIQESDYIKLVIVHGMGEWDEMIGIYVNDIDWTKYLGNYTSKYSKWTHLGLDDEAVVNNAFSQDEYHYRNLVISEVLLVKNQLISSVDNLNVVGRTTKCLEISEDAGGTASWTRNPAQIMWDYYITVEGKTSSDLNENAFLALEEYCAEPMSYADPYYSDINPPLVSADLCNVTTSAGDLYAAWRMLPKWTRKIGSSRGMSWLSGYNHASNQRINIDFGRKVVLTKLEIDNYHHNGAQTDKGIKNFKVQGSNSSSSFDDATFVSTGWTDVETGLQASQHTGSDVEDTEEFIFSANSPPVVTAYRYWSVVITDNWGNANYMGIRRLNWFGGKATGSVATEEYNTRYTFDYTFDSKISGHDAKKLICQSFHGAIISSQGKLKPVWEGAQEHDGSGSLQNKAVAFAFNTQTNVVAGSFSWNRLSHNNVFIINFIDSACDFEKDSVSLKREDDISNRGELPYDENCYYLIDRAAAKRRCKFNYNNAYKDWSCTLTGFPASQAVELYDRVTVTDTEAGWSAKDFLVMGKDEDQFGRPMFYCEEYLSGVYSDHGFEEQPNYSTEPINNYEPPMPIDSDTVTTTYNSPADSSIYASGSIRVQFTVPTTSNYSHTEIWLGTSDSPPNYRWAANDSDGDCVINGLGTFYDPDDTVYVKLRNVNSLTNVKEEMPDDYNDTVSVTAGSGAIITDHVQNNSITRRWSDFVSGPITLTASSSVSVADITLTPTGNDVSLFTTLYLVGEGFSSSDIITAHVDIYRDATLIGKENYVCITGYMANSIGAPNVPISVIAMDDSPGTSEVTYYVKIYYAVNAGSITNLYAQGINFVILETKK